MSALMMEKEEDEEQPKGEKGKGGSENGSRKTRTETRIERNRIFRRGQSCQRKFTRVCNGLYELTFCF